MRVYGALACCVIAAALALGYIFRGFLWEHAAYLYDLLGNRERLQALLKALGPWAPLLYILFQAVQVVVAPLPGEATGGFVSGFLFGPWLGLLYSLIGLTIGSAGGFLSEHRNRRVALDDSLEELQFAQQIALADDKFHGVADLVRERVLERLKREYLEEKII